MLIDACCAIDTKVCVYEAVKIGMQRKKEGCKTGQQNSKMVQKGGDWQSSRWSCGRKGTNDSVEVDFVKCFCWKVGNSVWFGAVSIKDLLHHLTDMTQEVVAFGKLGQTVLDLRGVVHGHHLQQEQVVSRRWRRNASDGSSHFNAVAVKVASSAKLAAVAELFANLMISKSHVKGQDSTAVGHVSTCHLIRSVGREQIQKEGVVKDVKVFVFKTRHWNSAE